MDSVRPDQWDYILNSLGRFGTRRRERLLLLPRKPLFRLVKLPPPAVVAGLDIQLVSQSPIAIPAAVRLDRIYLDRFFRRIGVAAHRSDRLDTEHLLSAFPADSPRRDRHELGRLAGARYVLLRLQRIHTKGGIAMAGRLKLWREAVTARRQRWSAQPLLPGSDLKQITDPAHLATAFEAARDDQNIDFGFQLVDAYQHLRGGRTGQRALAALQLSSALRRNGFAPRLVWPDGAPRVRPDAPAFEIGEIYFSSDGLPDSLTDYQLATIAEARSLCLVDGVSAIRIRPGGYVVPRLMLAGQIAARYGLRVQVPGALLSGSVPVAATSWCRFDSLTDFIAAFQHRDLIDAC